MRRSDSGRITGVCPVARGWSLARALAIALSIAAALVLACSMIGGTKPPPRSPKEGPLTDVEQKVKERDRDAGTHPEHEGPPPRYGDRVVREPPR